MNAGPCSVNSSNWICWVLPIVHICVRNVILIDAVWAWNLHLKPKYPFDTNQNAVPEFYFVTEPLPRGILFVYPRVDSSTR